jgi:hypothetical protein
MTESLCGVRLPIHKVAEHGGLLRVISPPDPPRKITDGVQALGPMTHLSRHQNRSFSGAC